jgi:hypothetical protein
VPAFHEVAEADGLDVAVDHLRRREGARDDERIQVTLSTRGRQNGLPMVGDPSAYFK